VDARPTRTIPAFAGLLLAILVAACSAAPAATPTLPPTTPFPSTAAAATPEPTAAPTASPTPAPPFPVSLTDDEGTAVSIPAEPQRIVTLTPAATETLFALGAGDRLVGKAEDIFLYPPEAGTVPDLEKFDGSAIAVDVEKIVAAKADLVIAGGNFGTPPDAVTRLRELGVPVLVVYAPSVEGVFTDIDLLGKAVGKPAQATAMVQRMRDEFAAVAKAVAAQPKPRVYYELDATGAYYGPADKSFLAEMITLAGGEPVTTGSADKYAIPAERLIAANPEVILLADAAYGVKPADVAKRPGFATMTAVKDGAIRPIDDTMITRPGPRLFLGLQLLASTIHPEVTIPVPSPIPPVP
jgi:iron complex transport system substrate-binding protein